MSRGWASIGSSMTPSPFLDCDRVHEIGAVKVLSLNGLWLTTIRDGHRTGVQHGGS